MDSSLPWLSFSLSNDPSNLSVFHSFDSQQGVMERVENGGCTDLSILGPKLEDFLGGGLAMNSPATETSDPPTYDSDLNRVTTAGFLPLDAEKALAVPTDSKKSIDTFGQRTSIYRGVTRHRWTGRYEAHLWDNSCRREGQSRKGRQGGYDKEDKAARAYDLAALKYWGPNTTTNFPVTNYEKELEEMKNMTRQEFVASLRRKSSGFSRGASIYRGVTRHHQHGRWQARIGRVAGNKDLYLGTFSTQEEAAEAYDIAAIKFRGLNAVTNFVMSRYDVQSIMSSNLPVGGVTNKGKTSESSSSSSENKMFQAKHLINGDCDPFGAPTSSLNFALGSFKSDCHDYSWSSLQSYQIINPSQNSTGSDRSTTTTTSAATFQSNNAPSLALDYSAASSLGHGYGAFSNGGVISVQESQQFSAATPTSLPSSQHDGSGYHWNCVIPSVHGGQYVRSNLLHTPIYGME